MPHNKRKQFAREFPRFSGHPELTIQEVQNGEFPRFSGHPELTIQEVQNAKTRPKNNVQVQ
jgi:hypothetical protein